MNRHLQRLIKTLLLSLIASCTLAALGMEASSSPVSLKKEEFRLRLNNLHTGESLDVAYRVGDRYLPSSVTLLNHFLRDYRTGEDADYDLAEFDLLYDLLGTLGQPEATINIICGYRSPETNEYLRTRAPVTGVAENSQHTLSRAIDISVPGVSTERLRDAALSLGRGGVGYYPSSHFVHVDVGPVREWAFGVRRKLVKHSVHSHQRRHHRT